MSVAFDAVGDGFYSTSMSGTQTFSHNATAGTKVILTVSTSLQSALSSVTYGGSAMTAVTGNPWYDNNQSSPGYDDGQVSVYYLDNVSGGAQTVSVTFATTCAVVMNTLSFTGAATGQPGTITPAYGFTAAPSSGSITATTGQLIFCALAFGYEYASQTITSPTGGTNESLMNSSGGSSNAYAATGFALSYSASSTTFGVSLAGAAAWATVALVLSAGGTPPTSAALTGNGALTATVQPAVVANLTGHGVITPQTVRTGHLSGHGALTATASPIISSSIQFDAIGAGYTTAASGAFSFTHTATAGADVFVDIVGDRGGVTSVKYGGSSGTAMTLVGGPVTLGTYYGTATYTRWHLTGVAGGAQSVYITPNGGYYWAAQSVSYTGVGSVGTASTLSLTTTGTSGTAALSQTVSCTTGQLILQGFGANSLAASGFSSLSGGTNRWNNTGGSDAYAALCISDATATTTFHASDVLVSSALYWTGIANVLTPAAPSGAGHLHGLGTLSATTKQKFSRTASLTGHGALSVTVANPGFKGHGVLTATVKPKLVASLTGQGVLANTSGPPNSPPPALLPVLNKLAAGQNAAILFIGDSTTFGLNDNVNAGYEPLSWCGRVGQKLGSYYNAATYCQDYQLNDQWSSPAEIFYGTGPTLTIMNAGLSGAVVGNFQYYYTTNTFFPGMPATPDAVFFALGINDAGGSESVSTFVSGYQTLISETQAQLPSAQMIVTSGCVINAVGYPAYDEYATLIDGLFTAIVGSNMPLSPPVQLSTTYPAVSCLDTWQAWTTWNLNVSPNGPLDDGLGIHPNGAGYTIWADWTVNKLAPNIVPAFGASTPALAGHGTLSAAVSTTGYASRSAALHGHGALSATAQISQTSRAAALHGQGALTATARIFQVNVNGTLSGRGALSATASAVVHPARTGALTGNGKLSATAHSSKFTLGVAISGTGGLTAAAHNTTTGVLAYFTVTGFYYDIESTYVGGATNAPQFNGWTGAFITFTPRVPPGTTVLMSNMDLGHGNIGSIAVSLEPITGRVRSGIVGGGNVWQLRTIDTTDAAGVQLLANNAPVSAFLTAQGIQSGQLIYDVSFDRVTFAGQNQSIQNFAFVAPTDGTPVCITDPGLSRLPYQPYPSR